MKHNGFFRVVLPAFLFTVVSFLTMGYHPGAEDDACYLAAVKSAVNPSLYPHGAEFFKLQVRTSFFDVWMSAFIHSTGISVAWAELLWQFLSLLFIVLACWSIVRQLFKQPAAQWAGIALVTAMFTLPVAGTALYLVDQYLHPRNPATALILWAVERVLVGRRWQAVPLLLLAFVLHPLMGAFGISFCCVLAITLSVTVHAYVRKRSARSAPQVVTPVAALIPFGWIFGPPLPTWLDAMNTRHLYFLYQWTWYEWLGAIGPLVLFWLVARTASKQGNQPLSHFATAILAFGIFQQILAMILLSPLAPVGFTTLEPMRYLHLVYVFLALIGGAYLGQYVLGAKVWRWAIFLLLANGGMFFAQRQLFAGTSHIELPDASPTNPWLQAFAWVRTNTPTTAYFALDPDYMNKPGEDYHGFRALAERSVLADAYKDTSTVTKQPELGLEWQQQVAAQAGWTHFQLADFERLKRDFGVNWVLVSYPQPAGLDCHWHNSMLTVCQIP